MARAADSLVLLGDPQQLDQPLQGTHPPGADRSALAHVLGEAPTMPPARGLFLEDTWRLHPDICDFTSEVFYEDRLGPSPLARQGSRRPGIADGTGRDWLAVPTAARHESPVEAAAVAALARELVESATTWTERQGEPTSRAGGHPDRRAVQRPGRRDPAPAAAGRRVGTVDKFQGQEAPIASTR